MSSMLHRAPRPDGLEEVVSQDEGETTDALISTAS